MDFQNLWVTVLLMTSAPTPWMFRQCWFNTPLWCRLDVLVRLCSTRTFFVQNKLNFFKSKSKKTPQ